jgi:hypothetical protein
VVGAVQVKVKGPELIRRLAVWVVSPEDTFEPVPAVKVPPEAAALKPAWVRVPEVLATVIVTSKLPPAFTSVAGAERVAVVVLVLLAPWQLHPLVVTPTLPLLLANAGETASKRA